MNVEQKCGTGIFCAALLRGTPTDVAEKRITMAGDTLVSAVIEVTGSNRRSLLRLGRPKTWLEVG